MIENQDDIRHMTAIALIKALDKAHPHECIGPDEDVIKAHRRAAKRELVDSLVVLLDDVENAFAYED